MLVNTNKNKEKIFLFLGPTRIDLALTYVYTWWKIRVT